MPDKSYANEWLSIAKHYFDTAEILYKADHYTDTIGALLQQSIEKSLKTILAYEKVKIPKTHSLIEILSHTQNYFTVDEDKYPILVLASNFYKHDKYPNPSYELPKKETILDVLEYTKELVVSVERDIN